MLFMAKTVLANHRLYNDTSRHSVQYMNAACAYSYFSPQKVVVFHGKTKLPNHQLYNKLYDRPSQTVHKQY